MVSEGTRARREELKENYHKVDSEKLYERSVSLLEEAEKEMREALLSFSKSEERYSDRRLNEMKRTFESMRDRIDSWQYHKANVDINKLTHAEAHLSPNGKPQERMLTIVQVINEIGIERLRTLLFSATFEEYQHLVYYE
ncbi:bacillithiol biosynthesis BshC [Geomicrobium sp. JCM 19055]|uniref:bacillithiol biosynthesis protein BshC n=1 Tax=Geomicrobium sp. JCM 19055 TaxID=1460649 RepID=UPI001267A399|nr:bacillithiol biosynthesis BshC [Geomicrobium sp. JCM 19055]